MIRNSYLIKSISLFLAFWMLTTSVGLSVDFHYCEGEIVDWSISGSELICEHRETKVEKSSCCEASHNVVCNSQTSKTDGSDCCRSVEAEMNVSQDFNLGEGEMELIIPLLIFASFQLNAVACDEDPFLCRFSQEKPPISNLRQLALFQTYLL